MLRPDVLHPFKEVKTKEKEQFNPRSVGIATATRYGKWESLPKGQIRDRSDLDGIRGDLALQTLKQATLSGFQVVVVDSPASSPAFKEALSLLQDTMDIHVHEEHERSTMSGGRRQALSETSKLAAVKVLAWIEPEKKPLIEKLIPAALPIIRGEADIVVPKRNEALFKEKYPDFQVAYEKRANERYNNLLKTTGLLSAEAEPLDAWFGPRLLKNDPKVLKHFMQENTFASEETNTYQGLDPELWPDTLFLSLPSALRAGLKVTSIEVDYEHPEQQTAAEVDNDTMREKRRFQHNTIIYSTVHELKRIVFDQSAENIVAHPSQRSRLKKIA